MSALVSLLGMVVLLLAAYLLSENRKAINLRTVGGAFLIQVSLGAFVLYVPIGITVLEWLSNGVQRVIDCGFKGTEFIFGGLVSPQMFEVFGGGGFVFAFRVLPSIIFFSSLIAVLYHLGVMQFVIRIFGGGLRKALGTSRTESMSASANIFVGQTEAPLVVRPYIPNMTSSELFAIMCGGLASIAGSVLAGYAGLGVDIKYLLAACFMAAPGGLLFAKLIKPETEEPNERLIDTTDDEDRPGQCDRRGGYRCLEWSQARGQCRGNAPCLRWFDCSAQSASRWRGWLVWSANVDGAADPWICLLTTCLGAWHSVVRGHARWELHRSEAHSQTSSSLTRSSPRLRRI